jgi:zinc protease
VSPAPSLDLRREQLPNGVTLLVQRRRAVPAVALVTHVRAGFLDEPDELVGISHVLEHMLFKGTPTLGPGELAQRTKALGGSLNAYTAYDRTVYYASVPARHARELIELQADQVRHPLLDADELRRELGVIIQEARRKLDTPDAVAGETLHELLFATHRLRRWRIGSEAMLEHFGRNDVAGYYTSRYVPERVIVALVGDVDEAAALDALRAAWGDWARPEQPIPLGPAETSVATVTARRLSGDVVLAQLVLGWRAPGVLDADLPALRVATALLGVGRGSRSGRRLREPGLVNSVGASNYGVVDAGVFSIGAELDPARLPEVLRIVGDAVRDLAERVPDAREFERATALLRARIGRRLERYESRALSLADAESLGDVTRLDREMSDVLAVTPQQVRDVVHRWLAADAVSAVAYLPAGSDAPFDTELLHDAMASSTAAPAGSEVRSGGQRYAGARSSDRAGEATSASGTSLPANAAAVRHLAVEDLDLLSARFGETGQVALGVYRARHQFETPANAGIAALAVRAMMRGTARHDAAALAFAMESLGGAISPTLGADLLGFGVTVLTENVALAARLLADVLYQPRFDADAISIERGLLLEDARAIADDMVRFPLQLALGVAFHDIGYGSPILGTPRSVETLAAADVRQWHKTMLANGRTTVVAVGDDDPEQLADELARAFEAVTAGRDIPQRMSRPAVIESVSPGVRVEHRDRKQSALAMLFPGPSRTDPERYAAETWGAIAAGLGGRMFESLRSARSLAYMVMANSWQRRRSGGLLTYIATDPARLDEARDAMLEELALFHREPPSAVEVSRASAMLAGRAEMSRQTASAFAGEIADAWMLGAGLQELDEPAAPYRQVTATAVHAVAARSLEPGLRAEGVVAAVVIE